MGKDLHSFCRRLSNIAYCEFNGKSSVFVFWKARFGKAGSLVLAQRFDIVHYILHGTIHLVPMNRWWTQFYLLEIDLLTFHPSCPRAQRFGAYLRSQRCGLNSNPVHFLSTVRAVSKLHNTSCESTFSNIVNPDRATITRIFAPLCMANGSKDLYLLSAIETILKGDLLACEQTRCGCNNVFLSGLETKSC